MRWLLFVVSLGLACSSRSTTPPDGGRSMDGGLVGPDVMLPPTDAMFEDATSHDVGVSEDAFVPEDAMSFDAGDGDAGTDAGEVDAGPGDAGRTDDAGPPDAGPDAPAGGTPTGMGGCSSDAECEGGACWDFSDYDSFCFGTVCSVPCSTDAECRDAAAGAGASSPDRATCEDDGKCNLMSAGLGGPYACA